LERTGSGHFDLKDAVSLENFESLLESTALEDWTNLSCWRSFDRMLEGYDKAEITSQEAHELYQGRQRVIFNIVQKIRRKPSLSPHLLPSENTYPIPESLPSHHSEDRSPSRILTLYRGPKL